MSDLEFLYAVMAAFYLWECTHWLPLGCAPFVSWLGRSFQLSNPFFIANSREAGLVFASPVPFFGTFLVTSGWPAIISPTGIANEDGVSFRFTDTLQYTTRRQQITVNGQRFSVAVSAAQARWWVAEWKRLGAAPEADRGPMIAKWIHDSLDCRSLGAGLEQFKQTARLSSVLAGVLFVFVFVVSPILILKWGFALVWAWLLGALLLLCLINAVLFFRAHKRLHPALDDERFAHFLMALLFPPAGMRVRDMLSRPLVERFHPLAVLRQTCAAGEFKRMAARVARELCYPGKVRTPQLQGAEPIRKWFNQAMLAETGQFLSRNDLDLEGLLCAPERQDLESQSYCPRCHAQFTRRDGECSDCGVTLVRFPRA